MFDKKYVSDSKYDGPLPKILEVRKSKLMKDSFILMKCIIYSKLAPSIYWLEESNETSHLFDYLGNYYQPVNRSESFPLYDDYIYYGEIKVEMTKEVKNYACLAITQFGNDIEVINIDIRRNGYQLRTISTSLFLVPLALILVPIIVWLCYFKNRKKIKENKLDDSLTTQIPLVHKLKTVCGNT